MNTKPIPTEWGEWSVYFHQTARKKVFPLLKAKKLKNIDVCLASYLAAFANTTTGRIEASVKQMAEEMGCTQPHLHAAIKRLRTQHLLVKGLKPTGYYWLLNPEVWHTGGYKSMTRRLAEFERLAWPELADV